jgi:hypothetical protein
MKILLAMILFSFMAGSSMARIVQHDDQSIDDDLSFKLDEKNKSEREVASDPANTEVEDLDKDETDSEREVASEGDDSNDSNIKYWKY